MAHSTSESELPTMKPTVSKRRRILNASAIIPVPVYSNQVSSRLQMKPRATLTSNRDVTDFTFLSPPSNRRMTVTLSSDSDEEEPKKHPQKKEDSPSCPSPPPQLSPHHKQSRKVQQKLSEIDMKLNHLFPEEQQMRSKRQLRSTLTPPPRRRDDDHDDDEEEEDDDVIGFSPICREIPLKVRCGTLIHKIPVQLSTPVSSVLTQLSVILEAPPPCLLLIRDGKELPSDSSIGQLGISITDIIECFIMAEESRDDLITVRLQNKDESQEFSLARGAPLGSIFTQFTSQMSAKKRKSVRFMFDGSKVSARQTPTQLDMEDGDIIEVWL